MVQEEYQDTWGDNDLADPELLPDKSRVLGEILDVDTSQTQPGNYRKFANPLKDGRTEVPIITVKCKARMFADGQTFEGANFSTNFTEDFWVGGPDVVGRNSLARLCAAVLGCKKEDFAGQTLTGVAKQIIGGKLSWDVNRRTYTKRDGTPGENQQMNKVKAATSEEMALMS